MKVLIIGAGVSGLCCALELAEAGISVEVIERSTALGQTSCSWFAGGMLAPWCEGEDADPLITKLGQSSLVWWQQRIPEFCQNGTLVLAQKRDVSEIQRFYRRTQHSIRKDASGIAELEPDLAGRFHNGLFFPSEAHIDPRAALQHLLTSLGTLGVKVHFGCAVETYTGHADLRIDCRGLLARDTLHDLRGVKGEMILLRCDALQFSRPIRLLHPRIPLYIVPRNDHCFMVGATMIESDDRRRISARSMIELLQGAYALHPAFAEAEILEIGTEVRPAFRDNLPKIRRRSDTLYVNGLYRHGFLLAPTLASWAKEHIINNSYYPEVMDDDSVQRDKRYNSRNDG